MNTIKCLFETYHTQHLDHHQKKNINSSPPPPPHEPSQKFLSPPGKSLHPSHENIATLLKHFKQLKKNLSPLH